MDRKDCEAKANEVSAEFNPERLSPFPFKNVQDSCLDLEISYFNFEGDQLSKLSGAISYKADTEKFNIYINSNRPEVRQYFTVAHELGHYFLHKELLKQEVLILDDEFFDGGRALFRLDETQKSQIEAEANYFAGALVMPSDLVKKAWTDLHSVEECAKVFSVSVSAMSIRLERLKLI